MNICEKVPAFHKFAIAGKMSSPFEFEIMVKELSWHLW